MSSVELQFSDDHLQNAVKEAATTLILMSRSNEVIDFCNFRRRRYEKIEWNIESRSHCNTVSRHGTTHSIISNTTSRAKDPIKTDSNRSTIRRDRTSGNASTVITEEIIRLIKNYEPPNIPPVPDQLRNVIGVRRSAPFQKQLKHTDLDENQNRFLINKEDVKQCIIPLLNGDEDLNEGIKVHVYDVEGKKEDMIYRTWRAGDKVSNVLICGWKKFVKEHGFEALQDFVTVWVFRHAVDDKLCFIFSSRRLPIFRNVPKKLLDS